MRKIKILLIGMSANYGGIETYIFNLIKNADRKLFSFDILYPRLDEMPYEEELKKLNCNIHKITPRTKNRKLHIKEIKNIYAKNYDYIHYNIMSYSWFEPIVLSKNTNSKLILHSHGNDIKNCYSIKRILLNSLGKHKIKNIKYYKIACGKQIGDETFKNNKYLIFNNGINIEKYIYSEKTRKEYQSIFGINKNEIVLGLVAAFNKIKNHTFLLNVFKEYQKLNKNCKLILIGTGKLMKKMKKKCQKLNIEDKVLFLGIRTDVNQILSLLDIYIMPSLHEGFPISLIEAQVNGLKCYASDRIDNTINISENVEFLSLNKSPKYWAEYINKLDNSRDVKVISKISNEFNSQKSYQKVYQFYIDNKKVIL